VQQERRPPLRHCRIDHSIAPETLDIGPSPYNDPCICFDYRSGQCVGTDKVLNIWETQRSARPHMSLAKSTSFLYFV
jgi:hypothetical protein